MGHSRHTHEVVAAARLVDDYAAEIAEATARVLAEPGNPEARRALEDAEQLHYLACHELRAARRRESWHTFFTRWTLVPWPARARRR
jgi:hypothetical protein